MKNMSEKKVHHLIAPLTKTIDLDCKNCNGACCKRVDRDTKEIHACQYLTEDNLCSIYEHRPIACRLDIRFHDAYSLEIHCRSSKLSMSKLINGAEATLEILQNINEERLGKNK
jgi:Fe-S-cluster containining protein